MDKEVAERNQNQDLEPSYFESYGQSAANTPIVGRLLKFNKGDWLAGQDEEELERGTQLVAVMDQLFIGWIKWVDSKPEEQRLGKVVEGYRPEKRKELGDTDETLWEVDDQGRARDPWQFTNHLILRNPGTTGEDDEDLYTFATSSRGGINAIGELCKAYGKAMRMKPEEWPVVELDVDSYNHSNKEFGRIKIPVIKLVDWEPKTGVAQKKIAAPAKKTTPAKTEPAKPAAKRR
jgi:hypothetical protein